MSRRLLSFYSRKSTFPNLSVNRRDDPRFLLWFFFQIVTQQKCSYSLTVGLEELKPDTAYWQPDDEGQW